GASALMRTTISWSLSLPKLVRPSWPTAGRSVPALNRPFDTGGDERAGANTPQCKVCNPKGVRLRVQRLCTRIRLQIRHIARGSAVVHMTRILHCGAYPMPHGCTTQSDGQIAL